MPHTYQYPRPAVTVDVVLFRKLHSNWEILLIQRKNAPFAGQWALPGGFLDEDEAPLAAAHRELQEETSLVDLALEPLGFFGQPYRDPRGHTISLVFWGITENLHLQAKAADDAQDVIWQPLDNLPPLAFDHKDIIALAKKYLQ